MSLHVSIHEQSRSSEITKDDTSPPIHLVLIHGGALSSRMFDTLIPYLTSPTNKKHYKVLTPDLPGHGLSSGICPFTFASSTKHLQTFLEPLNRQNPKPKIMAIGISLGGQCVLDLLQHHPELIDAAIVSGASISPPDDKAGWEMPRMPTEQSWIDTMMEDVGRMHGGMEGAKALQDESFHFRFEPGEKVLPPVLVVVGEHDVAMALRDFDQLVEKVKSVNPNSQGMVMKGAWHNHPIDVPQDFAGVIEKWVEEVF